MATSFLFGNQIVKVPGAYSRIESGIKNAALDLAFGNALVIDTGSGKTFGGGSGSAGKFAQGKDSLYTFDNIGDFQLFVGGGIWWKTAEPMFFPGGGASQGVSSLTFTRAATTAPASQSYTWTGGGANGGTVTIETRDEGLRGNGSLGDEVRATSTITVTAAGATADQITIEALDSGTTDVATYTNLSSDTIAIVVAGLVADAIVKGLVTVIASDATSLTISNIRDRGVTDNGSPYTVTVTGAMAGNASNFTGGVAGTKVTIGFAAEMKAGIIDTNKFIIEYLAGTYKGADTVLDLDNGPNSFNNLDEKDTTERLLVRTLEFDGVQELIDYFKTDTTFNTFFKFLSGTVAGDGSVDAADLTASAGQDVFAGGTETYSSAQIDVVLDNIANQTFDFILLDEYGDAAQGANNVKIQGWAATEAKIKPDLYIGGGADSAKFTQVNGSIPIAQFFNDENITVVHSGVKVPDIKRPEGVRKYDSLFTAAFVLGREAGIAPQVPVTFKALGIGGLMHNLTVKEIENGLDNGVLMISRDGSTFDIVKGVNTNQLNTDLVNPDGSTPSKQIRRISRQLNKELVSNATTQLLKNPDGSNRNTISSEDILAFVQGFLKNKVATDIDDDLILSYGNIAVNVIKDAYFVTYDIVPNFEVSFIFMTGFMLDPNTV